MNRWRECSDSQAPVNADRNPRGAGRATCATAAAPSPSTRKTPARVSAAAPNAGELASSDAAQHRADRHARMTEHQLDTAHQLAAAAPPIPRDARARAAVLLRPHPTHHIPERNAA